MRLLLRCNGFKNSFAVDFHSFRASFFCFPFVLVLFPLFLVSLEYCTLKNLEHFSFNSVRWGGSWYFRPSSRGGLANFTPIAGMGLLISEPKFEIPTPLPPLLISDKSHVPCLRFNTSKQETTYRIPNSQRVASKHDLGDLGVHSLSFHSLLSAVTL